MFISILQHTPTWVFVVFGALLLMGAQQAVARTVPLGRIVVLPLVFLALSLSGAVSAFGATPLALLAWAAGIVAGALAAWRAVDTRAVRFDAATRRLHLAGSWWPLALMMGVFALKFAVGVKLAMQPEVRTVAAFALSVSALYGVFSGIFLGRAMAFLSVARAAGAARSPVAS